MTVDGQTGTERRIRLAAAFLFVGLAVQFATLLVNKPLAFMAFILIGSPLVLVGTVLYLWSIVTHSDK
jgi:flagellar biosynthesis protein FliR